MNLRDIFFFEKIKFLGYDTIYTERPVSDLIDFDWKNIIPAPPTNLDKITKQELEIVYRATKQRTATDTQSILSIDKDIDKLFKYLIQNEYNLDYPETQIDALYSLVRPVLLNIKSYWNRPRPNQLAKLFGLEIDVVVTDTHHTASYPSGHTAYAQLVRNVLHTIYPQVNLSKLDYFVSTTGKARITQGVHYPSDNVASIVFSNFLFNKLYSKIL